MHPPPPPKKAEDCNFRYGSAYIHGFAAVSGNLSAGKNMTLALFTGWEAV